MIDDFNLQYDRYITAWWKEPGKPPVKVEIQNETSNFSRFFHGNFQFHRVDLETIIIFDFTDKRTFNCTIDGMKIYGDLFIVGSDPVIKYWELPGNPAPDYEKVVSLLARG